MDKLPPKHEIEAELEMWRDGNIIHENHRDQLEKLEHERNKMRNALESIEDRFIDGENTYDDWLFMATTARTVLYELRNHLR
jgi:hypothetical protein